VLVGCPSEFPGPGLLTMWRATHIGLRASLPGCGLRAAGKAHALVEKSHLIRKEVTGSAAGGAPEGATACCPPPRDEERRAPCFGPRRLRRTTSTLAATTTPSTSRATTLRAARYCTDGAPWRRARGSQRRWRRWRGGRAWDEKLGRAYPGVWLTHQGAPDAAGVA